MHAMKVKKPPRADISPGGRALRAAKSKIKDFRSVLQRMIEAATVAGNEREAHHLKETLAQHLNEARNDVTADPQEVAADLNKSLLTAAYRAHPAHRAAFAAIHQVGHQVGSTETRNAATVPARAERKKKLAVLDKAVRDEIEELGLTMAHSEECARIIAPGVYKRLGLKDEDKRPSLRTIKRALGRCLKENRATLTVWPCALGAIKSE
jgi:hypothetical protein